MRDTPFADLETWVDYFRDADIPVMRRTIVELDKLRAVADRINARTLSGVILDDPLMTLRVMAYLEEHRQKRQTTDITTIERALVMIGVEPFFRDFEHVPLIETQLAQHPKALLGVLKVIQRARHAAGWARDWGLHRKDLDVDEITVAALLHDTPELLMWCFAPALALEVAALKTADRHMRSDTAHMQVFKIHLNELLVHLAHAWRLPELLIGMMDNTDKEENPRELTVRLAVDLARHSANGWDDAALPDDYDAICKLLHMDQETLLRRLNVPTQA